MRSAGGIILQVGDNQFHIDPGPGALLMAKETGINLRANTAIFVTHNHLNHANDLNAVIDAMTYNGFDKKGVLVGNNTVINGSMHYEPFLHKYYRDFLERFIVMEAGRKVGINDVEIRAIKAKHSEPHAIGYKFITQDYTLTYTGDTAFSVDNLEDYEGSSVMIFNVPLLKKEDNNNNLCKDDVIKILNTVNPKLAIITHFGTSFLKSDPVYEVRDIQKNTNAQVIAAKDGMVVNPISYDIQQAQKTLYKYTTKESVKVDEFRQQEEEGVKQINSMIEEKQSKLENLEENREESKDNQ
jgi:ribonuclease BN (tRNA processing enzyme)